MSYHPTDGSKAVEPLALTAGDRVRLDWDGDQWWTVAAVSQHFAACTRPLTSAEREQYPDEDGPLYTVLDWRNGVRGPCNLIGRGWGNGSYGAEECAAMLAAFEVTDEEIRAAMAAHDGSAASDLVPLRVKVSQRNWAPLAVLDTQATAQAE